MERKSRRVTPAQLKVLDEHINALGDAVNALLETSQRTPHVISSEEVVGLLKTACGVAMMNTGELKPSIDDYLH